MAHIAGHYSATLGGTSIGKTEDGFRLRVINHHEPVHSDDFGDVPVDGIQRGVEYQLTLTSVEYDLIQAAIIRQGNALGESNTNVGKRLRDLAQQLVLTATAGTPAAGSIGTLTATKAIVVSDLEVLLAAKLRKGPVTFHLFPDPATGKAFTNT